jgi:ketosteroid isomerase-like protein
MSEIYAINAAKTELRDGYNSGDTDRVIAVFQGSGFTDMSEGEPSKYGPAAISALRQRLTRLFADYSVKMTPIIIDIVVTGSSAYDYGWHEFILTPKSGGELIRRRQRYFELWSKNTQGQWKIAKYFTNSDVQEELNGFVTRWFLSEGSTESTTAGA